ncbi:hypothetical protein [Streptomyces xiaopingdaonensis]|uniref:hypothetical protein n=1 Tax=Streptomyces xiaopingdaonensis TaxID=1565415 RepID=UPI000380BABC|nr:hypothetical protein [Streptomyces xiaopingdaonensis]
MVRYMVGSLIALVGAAAAVRSPFRDWYAGAPGRDIGWYDLFTPTGPTGGAGLFGGLFLPMLVAAVLVVLGVVLRLRTPVVAGGVVTLGVTILWMVRQALATTDGLTLGGNGVGIGTAAALAGGVVVLLGAAVMHGRRRLAEKRYRRRHHEHLGHYDAAHEPYDAYDETYRTPPGEPAPYSSAPPRPGPRQDQLPEERDTETLPPVTPLRPEEERRGRDEPGGEGRRAA